MRGELTANELRQAEEKITQEAQYERYPDEFDALKRNKKLPKRSAILHTDLSGRTVEIQHDYVTLKIYLIV